MNQKILKIEDFTQPVPYPPVENWFDYKHYIFRHNGDYTCSNCGHTYGKAFHKLIVLGVAICPNCRNESKVSHTSIRTNWENYESEYRAIHAQVHEGKILLRQFEVVQRFVDYKSVIRVKEIERTTIQKGLHVECALVQLYRSDEKWRFGHICENDRTHRPKQTVFNQPKSWDELVKQSELKYTGVGAFIDKQEMTWLFGIVRVLHNAAMYPWIELLMKSGMNRLYADIVDGHADMRYCRPKTIKNYRAKIIAGDRGASWLAKRRLCDGKGVKVSDDALEFADYKALIEIVKFVPEHTEKTIRYLFSINSSTNIGYYRDYLTMLDHLGTPADESTRYPKDLKKAHDDAVIKLNAIKREKDEKSFAKRYQVLKRLEWGKGGIYVVAPKCAQEILDEGRALHHCVGSYVDKVISGETNILFVRADKNEPLYTMEYKNGQIVQVRAKNNQSIPPEVRKLLDEWRKVKNRRKETISELRESYA